VLSPEIIPDVTLPLVEEVLSCISLPPADEILVATEPLAVMLDDVILLGDLQHSSREDSDSLVPLTLVMEEMPHQCVLLLPQDDESISMGTSQEREVPLISDDWGIVTATRLDDLVTCYEIQSSRFVLQDYILLCNSIEVPDDNSHRSRRGRIPSQEEQDCWELVTLYVINPGVLVIKIELEIISSEYFVCFN
jgi:hypothetical protein